MKNFKKSLFVFCVFWIIGIVGGYYIGLKSSAVPTENIEYGYYFSKTNTATNVETVKSVEKKNHQEANKDDDENSVLFRVKSINLMSFPKYILYRMLSPSACTDADKKIENCKKA